MIENHEDYEAGVMGFSYLWEPRDDGRYFVPLIHTPHCFHVACEDRELLPWPAACGCTPRDERNRFWDRDCAEHGRNSDWKYAREIKEERRSRVG